MAYRKQVILVNLIYDLLNEIKVATVIEWWSLKCENTVVYCSHSKYRRRHFFLFFMLNICTNQVFHDPCNQFLARWPIQRSLILCSGQIKQDRETKRFFKQSAYASARFICIKACTISVGRRHFRAQPT